VLRRGEHLAWIPLVDTQGTFISYLPATTIFGGVEAILRDGRGVLDARAARGLFWGCDEEIAQDLHAGSMVAVLRGEAARLPAPGCRLRWAIVPRRRDGSPRQAVGLPLRLVGEGTAVGQAPAAGAGTSATGVLGAPRGGRAVGGPHLSPPILRGASVEAEAGARGLQVRTTAPPLSSLVFV
jgi:hypothetical protein